MSTAVSNIASISITDPLETSKNLFLSPGERRDEPSARLSLIDNPALLI